MNKMPCHITDEVVHNPWEDEVAQEVLEAQLDEEMDKVANELDEGKFDSELFQSLFIDAGTMARIARMAARNFKRQFPQQPDVHALKDLGLQLEDFIRDMAEYRLGRK